MDIVWGRYVVTMDGEKQILRDAGVAFEHGRIAAVEPIEALRRRWPGAREVGGRAFAVLPGLVNTHMHLCCSLFRGYIDDLPLLEHDVRFLFPGQRAMTPDDVYQASLLSSMELLKSGVTTTTDAYLHPHASARAIRDSGIRGVVSPAMMDVWLGGETRPVVKSTSEALGEVQALHGEWHGAADGRISVWLAPFTDLSASPALMRESAALARKWGVGIQIHLGETFEGVNLVKRTHGKRVLEHVEACGLLEGTRVVAAHCCWLSEPDIDIVKRYEVAVSYCPSSEMKMADGIPPISRLLHDGVCVGVAIDATCVNNGTDMFHETKLGALLQKSVYPFDAELIPAEQALEMITSEPARALGMQDAIGSLEAGKKADVIALRIDKPHFVPLLDRPRPTIVNHLVYSASSADVSEVFVNGQHVVAGGCVTTVDEAEVVRDAQRTMEAFVARSGIEKEITPLRWLPRRVAVGPKR